MSPIVLGALGGVDTFGLVASALVVAYLLYALLRGERL